MKVLLVDDEPQILNLLEEFVEEEFFCQVDKAGDGLDAFLLCINNKYDFIITDHRMPYMTGAALISAIKTKNNLNKKTPIAMVTAYATSGLDEIPELKGVDFLKKPIDFQALKSKMSSKMK